MVSPKIVGELACQQNSYLYEMQTKVVSCVEVVSSKADSKRTKKNKEGQKSSGATMKGEAATPVWEIECEDSVLFPEGGGQPADHGTLIELDNPDSPIPIQTVHRDGLRAVIFSSRPLAPGTIVTQQVDSRRRMDHMQQHTGQHLLSAIMDTYPGLETLGWSMGASTIGSGGSGDEPPNANYVELGRKPTEVEMGEIQDKCNQIVFQNRPITVSTPQGAKHDSLPDDYDREQGVVRVVTIDGIDENPSITFATTALRTTRSIASTLSTGSTPAELASRVTRVTNSLRDTLRAKRKLEAEIAGYLADRVVQDQSTWVHRTDVGLDFLMDVVASIPTERLPGALVLAAGSGTEGGAVLIVGNDAGRVQSCASKATAAVRSLKGGGKGVRWQGKVQIWEKGDLDTLQTIATEVARD